MIDIHAHYDDDAYNEDREQVLDSIFNETSVKRIINAGCNLNSSLKSIELAERFEGMYAAVGFHPQEADSFTEADFEKIKQLLSHKKVVAVGEIGLDYHWRTDNKDLQKEILRKQLQLAIEADLPVIIHERDCVADCLEIVLDYDVRGVFHAFSGSKETAKLLLDRGWYISFCGTVTFKNAKFPVENALYVPEDRILTETDAPYLTAHPFRGKRNDSGYMKHTLEKIAEIRGKSLEYIERVTEENAKRLFGI